MIERQMAAAPARPPPPYPLTPPRTFSSRVLFSRLAHHAAYFQRRNGYRRMSCHPFISAFLREAVASCAVRPARQNVFLTPGAGHSLTLFFAPNTSTPFLPALPNLAHLPTRDIRGDSPPTTCDTRATFTPCLPTTPASIPSGWLV